MPPHPLYKRRIRIIQFAAILYHPAPPMLRSETMRGLAPVFLAALLPVLTDTALHAQQPPPEKTPQQIRIEQQRQFETDMKGFADFGDYSIRDAVKLSVDSDDLLIDTDLPRTEGPARIRLKELSGFTQVNVQSKSNLPDESPVFQLIHHDFSVPNTIAVHTSIFVRTNHLQIARDFELLLEERSLSLIQSRLFPEDQETGVRLFVKGYNRVTGDPTINLKLEAPTIVELHRRYPLETAEHLQPIFRDLRQDSVIFSIEPHVAWQVFTDDLKPDPALAPRVDELVARLGSDVFRDRESAFTALEEMGHPAILHLAQIDRATLSAEQISRIDTLTAPYRPLDPEEAAKLAESPDFLLDCLYNENETIRELALKKLAQVVGREIPFDPTLEGQPRLEAITTLRAELQTQKQKPPRDNPQVPHVD